MITGQSILRRGRRYVGTPWKGPGDVLPIITWLRGGGGLLVGNMNSLTEIAALEWGSGWLAISSVGARTTVITSKICVPEPPIDVHRFGQASRFIINH